MARKAPAGCYWRDNTLWAQVMVKGQRIQWSLDTDNPKLASQRRQAGKERALAELIHGDAVHTLDELIKAWGAHFKAQSSETTFTRYMVSLGQLAPFLEGCKLLDINARLIGDIVAERQKVVTNATIRRDLGALSSVLNYAVERGWCAGNPVLPRLRGLKERRDPIVLPSDKDIELVISRGLECDRRPGATAVSMWPQLIRAAWVTGARQAELVTAKLSQLDHRRQELTLVGKGNKMRVIDLRPFDGYQQAFANLPSYVGCDLLFWHDRGEPYRNASSNFANNLIGSTLKFARGAGVAFTPFRFHDLRHKHAVDWLQSGRDLYDLQKRLGHSTIAVTEGYLKYVTTAVERAAKYGRGK
jgi:integrase/recombinase XerD